MAMALGAQRHGFGANMSRLRRSQVVRSTSSPTAAPTLVSGSEGTCRLAESQAELGQEWQGEDGVAQRVDLRGLSSLADMIYG